MIGAVLILGGDSSLTRSLGIVSGEDISSGRLHFWYVALMIFFDHPILGSGLDAFGVVFTKYDTWPGIYRVEQAHNDYLQMLADAGIAGFGCVAAFIYLLFSRGLTNIFTTKDKFRRAVSLGALAGCFGVLVHSFFDFPLRTPANAFFFLMLAAISVASVRRIRH
jgi:O-antigen ligase